MPIGLATITLLVAFQTTSPQQTAKASIEGIVLRAGTDEPVLGTHVKLIRNSQLSAPTVSVLPSATTDNRGYFVLENIDPGAYRLTLSSNGFVKQEYGQKVFPGQGAVLSVAAGAFLKGLVAHLSPTGNAAGRIRDVRGNPAVDVPIQLFRSGYRADGTRGLQYVGGTKSDDRGEYRFYWLTPDTYFLYAGGPMSGPGSLDRGSLIRNVAGTNAATNKVTEIYRPVFYGNVTDLKDATPIRIHAGDEVGAIDFALSSQTLLAIRGRVDDTTIGTFASAAEVTVQTSSLDGKLSTYSARSYYNNANGTFDIPDLVPGSYTIIAARTGATPAASGSIDVILGNTDLNGVSVQIHPTRSILGRVSVDSSVTGSTTFELRQVSGGAILIPGAMSPDGTVKFDNVPQGNYWLICTNPKLFIQAARYGTTDILNRPLQVAGNETSILEVALSSKGAELSGVARDGSNMPASGSVAVLVPNQLRERADLYRATTTDQNGEFTISNIPPGDYTVFVWDAIERYAWFDQELLVRLDALTGSGKIIHLTESSRESIDVRTIAESTPR